MKRSNRQIATKVLLVTLVIGIALAVLCAIVINTSAFRSFLRSEIIEQAYNLAGARVEIGEARPHWTHLAIDLRNVVVHGSETQAEPPLLRADQLEVSAQFIPLIHRQLKLHTLIVDQPVLHLRVDSQRRNNLPTPPNRSTSGGSDSVFNLAIQNCVIRSGEIYYNDKQLPLDVDLHNLQFAADYSLLKGGYSGSISYDKGRLTSRWSDTFESTLQAQFTADRAGMNISSLTMAAGASHVTLSARLTNYASPDIDGKYEGFLATPDLARILRIASLPVGKVGTDGTFAYRASDRPFLLNVAVQGRVASDNLMIETPQGAVRATALRADYELKEASLRVDNFAGNVLGGRAKGNFSIAKIDTAAPLSRLNVSVQAASLANASDSLAPRNLRKLQLVGTVNADVKAAWSGPIANSVAHFRLAIAAPKAGGHAFTIPVNGLIQANYDGPRNTLTFAESYVQTGGTKITMTGTLGRRRGASSNLALVATSDDLHESADLVSFVVSATEPSGHAEAMNSIPDLHGSGRLNVRVSGTLRDPQIQGELSADRLGINRTRWRSLVLSLDATSSRIDIHNAKLAHDPRGLVAFNGSVGLDNWSLPANGAVSLQANVADISADEAEGIAGLQYPVTGAISADISVKGTRKDPTGSGNLTISHGSAWNEPVDSFSAKADFSEGDIHSAMDAQIPAGKIHMDATYRLESREYDAKLSAQGLKLEQVPAIQHGLAIQGMLNLSATGHGTLQDPGLEANITIPQLQINDQVISKLAAQVTVAHQQANVTLHSTIDQGAVEARGQVALTGERYTTASLDVTALPTAAVLASFLPAKSSNVKGQMEIHLTLKGPLKSPEQMEAHLEVPSFDMNYGGAQLGLAHPLLADYRDGTVTIAPTELRGTGTNLTVGGSMPIRGEGPYALSANGSIDLSVAQKFVPGVRSSGQVDIHVSGQGTSGHPGMQGQLKLINARLSTDAVPVGIEGLNAQINFSGSRADIVNFSGAAGGGTVTGEGFVTYGKETYFSLALNADSVRLLYPDGLRSILSGRVNLNGAASDSTLSGRVLVDRMSFTQAFDLSNFAAQFSQGSVSESPSEFSRGMKLNVSVLSSQDLNLANSKVSLGGTANLNVIGTLASPVVLGRITLTSGDVFFLGKRFAVQSGAIQFANPARTEPVVRMNVTTTIEQYDVTLVLSGPIDRLRTNYTSEPALPPADIIHLLAFGKTNAEAASAPTSSPASSAESVLASGVSSQVAGKLENLTGISQLTIDPLATNSQGNPGSQVAIQERVTGSLLLTFSTDVTSTQDPTVELQYDLSKRTSVTVLRDQNGGYGIGIRLHRVF